MTTRVAIITARGGSKHIPRKNIKFFYGKPIIAYSIIAAQNSNCFDEIMVSTDDEEIAEISIQYGASVPFFRSPENSDDYSGTVDVLTEVISEYKRRNINFDEGCCLYPTAPFITTKLLIDGLTIMNENDASSLIPVSAFAAPIWRALKIEDNKLKRIWVEYEKSRSQDLSPTYYDIGQFYWFNVEKFMEAKSLLTNNTVTMIIDQSLSHDIDTIEDWQHAELKYKCLFSNKTHNPNPTVLKIDFNDV